MGRCTASLFFIGILTCLVYLSPAQGQSNSIGNTTISETQDSQVTQPLSALYQDWLTEDVPYIITSQERQAFLRLTNDQARDDFIEQFWERRNPDPDSPENEYEEEFYRRIVYTNANFSTSAMPGWKTVRGSVYIEYGPPDHATSQNIGDATRLETWTYRYLDGMGPDASFEFVDRNSSGDFFLISASPSRYLLSSAGVIVEHCGDCGHYNENADVLAAAPISPEFKALETIAVDHLSRNDNDYSLSLRSSPVTHVTGLLTMEIHVPVSQFMRDSTAGHELGALRVFCRISERNGRVAQSLEETVSPPKAHQTAQASMADYSLEKSCPLRIGSYTMTLVIQDSKSGAITSTTRKVKVSGLPTLQ